MREGYSNRLCLFVCLHLGNDALTTLETHINTKQLKFYQTRNLSSFCLTSIVCLPHNSPTKVLTVSTTTSRLTRSHCYGIIMSMRVALPIPIRCKNRANLCNYHMINRYAHACSSLLHVDYCWWLFWYLLGSVAKLLTSSLSTHNY